MPAAVMPHDGLVSEDLSGRDLRQNSPQNRLARSGNLQPICSTIHWPSIIKIIKAGRSDFMLASFHSATDMAWQRDTIKLYLIADN